MTQTRKWPPPAQGSGPLELSSSAADFEPNSPNASATQINSRAVRLRLSRPPGRLGRETSMSEFRRPTGREPIGRTRPLKLTESDLDWLIDEAAREAAMSGRAQMDRADAELAEQGYRVLCWTCDYSSCQCHAFDNMPKLVFSRPSPRNSKGLPMIRPTERVILPSGTLYEEWRTDVEVGDGQRHPTSNRGAP